MTEYNLTQGIISCSVAKTWDEAKLEWTLMNVYRENTPDTCLCGHFPINEICVLLNKRNNNTAIVGNSCVKKFIGLPSDKIFDAVKRISADIEQALNAETIDHAHRNRWINEWERDFYFDTMRKRKITVNQADKRIEINRKVLSGIVNARQRVTQYAVGF